MSEVQAPRPQAHRGRGSSRGGRGGFSSRGGRGGSRSTNTGKPVPISEPTFEDEGELGQLKKQYSDSVTLVKEMFPEWTAEDIVFALEENEGNLERTIEQISEGNIAQWGEVKKKSKTTKGAKEPGIAETATSVARSSRGRGNVEGSRGGRGGRSSDHPRGFGRGARGGPTGGRIVGAGEKTADPPSTETSMINDSTSTWESTVEAMDSSTDANQGGTTSPDASWEMVVPSEATPPTSTPEVAKPSLRPDGTRSWASMLKPAAKPRPTPAKSKAGPVPAPVDYTMKIPVPTEISELPEEAPSHVEEPVVSGIPAEGIPAGEITPTKSPSLPPSEPALNIAPSGDKLTEENLEQVKDISEPVATETVMSTVGTEIADNGPGAVTPLFTKQQLSGIRPGMSGFAASAQKATAGSGRSASFQKKVKEQQEAVVMPSNHAVDRAAVQFGSLGLSGNTDDFDTEENSEAAETRAQPPQHSPVAPRASLPLAHQAAGTEIRPAPGLPAVQQSAQASGSVPGQENHQQAAQAPYNQFNNRYGLPTATTQPDSASTISKSYEPFGQQLQQASGQQHQIDYFRSHTSAKTEHQSHFKQMHIGGFSSTTNDYLSYYTSDNQRNPFHNIYGGQASQEPLSSQQRTGFSSSGMEQPSQYATSLHGPQATRFAGVSESQNSGHSTPNPTFGQTVQSQSQTQTQQMGHGQGHGQAHAQTSGQHGGYYGAPYYNQPYYSQYMNQGSTHSYGRDRPMFDDARRYEADSYGSHNYGYGAQGGYGSGPYGKYGQPQQGYGMSPQNSYDHTSTSTANVGGYGQQMGGRDISSSAFGGYGRTGSTQPTDSHQQSGTSSGAFGGMPDVFGRSPSGYPAQPSSQQTQQGANDDSVRGYGDSGKPGGPSPVPGQAGGRPGSAANSMPGQSNVPGLHNQGPQGGYGGYPSHQMHGGQHSGYGGLGGLGGQHHGGAQSHQTGGYGGAYGAGFGGSYYGGNNNRGGWSGNYGH